jgi:hypothetical protein
LIQRCFPKKNGEQKYQYLVIGRNKSYFAKDIQNLDININRTRSFKYYIIQLTAYLSCLVDRCFNKRLVFHWLRFVSTRLWDFLQWPPKNKDRKLSQIFNSSFRYIDDVLLLNNYRFSDYLYCIYTNELEVKDTTDAKMSASYLDLHFEIDNRGRFSTKPLRQTEWLYFSNSQLSFHQ